MDAGDQGTAATTAAPPFANRSRASLYAAPTAGSPPIRAALTIEIPPVGGDCGERPTAAAAAGGPASSASAQSSSAPLLSMSERKAGKMAAGGGGGERRRSPASAGLDARGPAPAAADDGPLLRAPAIRSDVIVQLNNIHKTYLLGVEGVPALRGVSMRICRGEWVVVYGTSGGGKTSLLNIIGTVDTPTKGDLTVCGTKITSRTKDAELAFLRLTKLGFVFQTFNLLPSMTARENVELPMMLAARRSPAERRAAAAASLHSVGLSHRLGHFPNQLSGGEQQRVTIARAIANSPELLLLDEPTGDLDTANTNKIVELLHRLNLEQSMTLVMVTHDVHLKNFAHRVVYMRDGKVAKEEIVKPACRQHAIAELYGKLGTADRPGPADSDASAGGGGGGPSNTPASPAPRWAKTEIRVPRQYPTFSESAFTAFSFAAKAVS